MRVSSPQERPSATGQDGRYTIVKKLADGGMAEIFLANQTGAEGFERPVILKRILPALSADPQFRNMLIDEAHVAMGLRHSNIAQVLDLGEANGRTFLVLELVDGWDLHTIIGRARMARTPLPLGLALHVVAEVCRGLAYAHRYKRAGKPVAIVHRDISPQNVLISAEGEVKLTDFGIAKALGRRERTQAGVIKGKLDFMSPEQAAGAPVDARSDIFSMGTVLYLLVTGERPITGTTELEILLKVQKAEYTPPEVAKPDLPPRIAALVNKAMRKLPSERYQNAEEMLGDVERVLQEDFRSAGPTELKRWLEALAKKDREPPISQADGLPSDIDDEEATGKTLALRPTQELPALARTDTDVDAKSGGKIDTNERTIAAPRKATPVETEAAPARVAYVAVANPSLARPRPVRRLVRLVAGIVLLAGATAAGFWIYAPHKGRKLLEQGQRALEGARNAGADLADKLQDQAFGGAPSAPPVKAPDPKQGDEDKPSASPDEAETAEDARRRVRPGVSEVSLITRPPGATVRTGTRRLGVTPVALTLKTGVAHELSFTKTGFVPAKRTVRPGADGTKVVVELAKRKAKRRR